VKPGDMVLQIPGTLCMNSEEAVHDPIISQHIKAIPALWRLAILLLHHKLMRHEDSAYAPYVQSLPPYILLPLVYTKQQTAMLKGTRAHVLLREQRRVVEEAFQRFLVPLAQKEPELFPPKMFIAQEFQWAVTVLWSRAFSHHNKGGEEMYTLVPILDMANHKPWRPSAAERMKKDAEQTFLVRTEEGTRTLYAPHALRAGQELHNDYGVLTSEQLLLMYGYVPSTNPDDGLELALDVRNAQPQVLQLLRSMKLLRKDHQQLTLKLYEKGISPGMLSVHRLVLIQGDEFQRHQQALRGQSISAENDRRVALLVLRRCKGILAELDALGEEKQKMAELEAKNAADQVRSRAELAILRYRKHLRSIVVQNIQYFTDLGEFAGPNLEL